MPKMHQLCYNKLTAQLVNASCKLTLKKKKKKKEERNKNEKGNDSTEISNLQAKFVCKSEIMTL